jgi:hypothetical protein
MSSSRTSSQPSEQPAPSRAPSEPVAPAPSRAASSGPGVGSIVIWRDEAGREQPAIVLSSDDTPDGLALVAAGVGRGPSGRLELSELSGAASKDDGPGWRAP